MGKNTHRLREFAKFASGLVAGDLLVLAWFWNQGMIPVNFWGITFSTQIAAFGIAFDFLLLMLLIHYGWHAEIISPSTNQKTYYVTVGIVFSIIAAIHFLRLFFEWYVQIGSWVIPHWLNGIGIALATYLAYSSFHFAWKKR